MKSDEFADMERITLGIRAETKYLYVGDWGEKKKVVMRYEGNRTVRLKTENSFFI